jgi:hypothetical protein
MIHKLFAKAILEKANSYKWSVQGLGMLRLYLSDEVRLHVWDNRFKIPGVSPLHDHPWDFESLVVAGAVRQYRYTLVPKTYNAAFDGGTKLLTSYNMTTIKCGPDAEQMAQKEVVWLEKQPVEFYVEGQHYRQEKYEIHESEPLSGTVTLVRRTFKGDRDLARVFWKEDGPFVSAGARPATPEEVETITQASLKRWFVE